MTTTCPDPIEALLAASGAAPEHLGSVIDELGLDAVAHAVVDELGARFLPSDGVAGSVLLEIHRGAESVEHTVTVDGPAGAVTPGVSGDPGARIRFEAADLVTALYGPAGRHGGMTGEVESLLHPAGRGTLEDAKELSRRQHDVAGVVQTVVAACSTTPPDLGDLAVRYRSDKWGLLHWYTAHYERHLRRLVDEPIRLLEIGVGGYGDPGAGGASLRMWQRWFRRGTIYGLDVFDKSPIRGPRLHTIQGDQNDPGFLAELGRTVGPFDVVIDDGSHLNEHVRTSFDALFPSLRDGGLYVIEDSFTSYWPGYGGSTPDEPGTAESSMERVKELVDGLYAAAWRERPGTRPALSPTERGVSGIHCYRDIVFVEKMLNLQGDQPAWVPRVTML